MGHHLVTVPHGSPDVGASDQPQRVRPFSRLKFLSMHKDNLLHLNAI